MKNLKNYFHSLKKQIISFCLILLGLYVTVSVQAQENKITYYLDSAKYEISRHIYGHFAEHLGRCIYDGFWVDENMDVPKQDRIRLDIVDALKEIGIPNLRWPGGCFADEYHWKDGIGPREERPTMINTNWGGVTEDNSFGTHEFIELCNLLNCEPVICGNLGSGTVQEMSQWVEYLNSTNISPMTELRRINGSEDAFNVKYFGLGNENWGCGGRMTPEYYANEMRRYSTYAKDHGENRLYKIAGGPNSADYNWTETLMSDPKTRNSFNGMSLHYYTRAKTRDWNDKGSATQFDEHAWFSTMNNTLNMEELITKHSAIMDKYDPNKQKGLIIDEWGNWHDAEPGTNPRFLYQQNTLRDALVASINLDIFNNHCDRVKMANIAQTINVLQSVILTKEKQLVFTPTYYVFKMYKVHQDATLIPHQIVSDEYTLDNRSIESIHTSCSKDKNGLIHITISNLDPNNNKNISCNLKGIKAMNVLKSEIITASEINSYNDFDKAEEVRIESFKEFKIKGNDLILNMPSKSVVMIEISNK
jgi:alpha-L-arabinofuranosidase